MKNVQRIPIDNIIDVANSQRYPYFNDSNKRYWKSKQDPTAYKYENVGFFIESTKKDDDRKYSVCGFNFTKADVFDISTFEEFDTLNKARKFLSLVVNSGLAEHFYWHVHYQNQCFKYEERERAKRVLKEEVKP